MCQEVTFLGWGGGEVEFESIKVAITVDRTRCAKLKMKILTCTSAIATYILGTMDEKFRPENSVFYRSSRELSLLRCSRDSPLTRHLFYLNSLEKKLHFAKKYKGATQQMEGLW